MQKPEFQRAQWGVIVEGAPGKQYNYQADKFFVPCSVLKLLTAAAALEYLGTDYCIRTSVLTNGAVAEGVIHGDLLLYGRGDPGLKVYSTAQGDNSLQTLVEALKSQDIRAVTGNIIGDDHYFLTAPFFRHCEWQDTLFSYAPELSVLSLEGNCIPITLEPSNNGKPCEVKFPLIFNGNYLEVCNHSKTVSSPEQAKEILFYREIATSRLHLYGALTTDHPRIERLLPLPNPPLWAACCFKKLLIDNGIQVLGEAQASTWIHHPFATDINSFKELTAVVSAPLQSTVQSMLKDSDNLAAQLLLLQIGAYYRDRLGYPQVDRDKKTAHQGLKAIEHYWKRNAQLEQGFVMVDGSGLSRHNLITPKAVLELLRFVRQKPYFSILYEGLPLAGTDGTLKARFIGTPLAQKVRAKTGSMTYHQGLAGFALGPSDTLLSFCIFLNNFDTPNGATAARQAIDELLAIINSQE